MASRGRVAILQRMLALHARRRRWIGASNPGPEPEALLRSEEFFHAWRDRMERSNARLETLPEGDLYYEAPDGGRALWTVLSPQTLIIAGDATDTPEQIRARVREWHNCLARRCEPGTRSGHWGDPVYGARFDPATSALHVQWARMGEWTSVLDLPVAFHEHETVPAHWAPIEVAGA